MIFVALLWQCVIARPDPGLLVSAGKLVGTELVELAQLGPKLYCGLNPATCIAAVDITAQTATGTAAPSPSPHLPSATNIEVVTEDLAATKAALSQEIGNLRATLPSGPKTSGNMGVAQIDIPGIQSTMAASSQVQAPTATQAANGFVGQVPEIFPSSVVPSANGTLIDRVTDSEAKILNNIATQLGDNISASGTINLLTERPPCSSCSNVINLFKAKYPNITINVLDNGGANIPPTKKGP